MATTAGCSRCLYLLLALTLTLTLTLTLALTPHPHPHPNPNQLALPLPPPGFEMVDARLLRREAELLLSDGAARASTMVVHPHAAALDGLTAGSAQAQAAFEEAEEEEEEGGEEVAQQLKPCSAKAATPGSKVRVVT